MASRILRRRTMLQLLAGSVIAGVHRIGRASGTRIVIAGAGIVGAQLAYRLARRGAEVTVLERAAPAAVATAASFAWINATWDKQPVEYFRLNCLGIEAWHQLESELPGALPLRWGGSVEWYADAASATAPRAGIRRNQAWGYPIHRIDGAELRRLEPKLEPGAVALAAHAASEGQVDPVRVTQLLLDQATRAGARVRHPVEVRGLVERNGRLRAVQTSDGEVEADVLLIACGTDTPVLARMAGFEVPLQDAPGMLVHTPALPPLLGRVVLAPMAHMKQKPDGRIVVGADFEGSSRVDASLEAARRVLQGAAKVLPALATVEPDFVTMGFRPLPRDGFPVIGFAPGRRDVYVTVMHSGVTLSPAVANLAATELLDGVQAEPLSPYRPARFAS